MIVPDTHFALLASARKLSGHQTGALHAHALLISEVNSGKSLARWPQKSYNSPLLHFFEAFFPSLDFQLEH